MTKVELVDDIIKSSLLKIKSELQSNNDVTQRIDDLHQLVYIREKLGGFVEWTNQERENVDEPIHSSYTTGYEEQLQVSSGGCCCK